jgi:tRNA G18 (ribose-2'-O)-methylase SpoU
MSDAKPVERFRAARRDPAQAVLEGFHALKHAMRFGAELIEAVTCDEARVRALAAELAPDLGETLPAALRPLDEATFRGLAPSPPATPVLARAARPAETPEAVLERVGPLLLLEAPTHLGNVGACVRVAAAAGAGGVITTGEHDPWDPAALRGGAGLHFAIGVAHAEALPETKRPLIAIDPEGERLGARPMPADAVLAFGTERAGLSADLLDRADRRVAIPMRPGVSSLNLAASAAVVLYAARPQ